MKFKRLLAHKTKPFIILECVDQKEKDKIVYLTYENAETVELENETVEKEYEVIENKIIIYSLIANHLKAISKLWERNKNNKDHKYQDSILRAMISYPSPYEVFEL